MLQLDWNTTISYLKEEVSPASFQNWIKPLRLIRCDDASVVVGVPNQFHRDWLQDHYQQKINRAIQTQTGTQLELQFELMTSSGAVKMNEEATQNISSSQVTSSSDQKPHLVVVPGFKEKSTTPSEIEKKDEYLDTVHQIPAFESPFIESSFNRLAHQCAKLFSSSQKTFNPFIVVGDVGMGKTHLLSQVGQWFLDYQPDIRVRYVTAEKFTSEMVYAIKTQQVMKFKHKYVAETDVLLFDNLHEIVTRKKTQQELMHIFDELTHRGGKVCFTSRKHPYEMEGMCDSLQSRLLSGVATEIKPVGDKEKHDFLTKKIQLEGIELPESVVESLSVQGQTDVRELVGSLIRIQLQADIQNKTVLDEDFIKENNRPKIQVPKSITIEDIEVLVISNYAVTHEGLVSKSRKSVLVWARQVAMYLARNHTHHSLEEIGSYFGRDHATVVHSFQKVKDNMSKTPSTQYEIQFLSDKLASDAASN